MPVKSNEPEKKQSKQKPSQNRFLIIFFLILLVGGTFAYNSFKTSSREQSVSSAGEELLVKAQKEGKPIYLLFHSTSCQPCQIMEAMVRRVFPSFAKEIVFVDVNVYDQSEQPLIERFGIQSIPTSVFIGKDGKIKGSYIGVLSEKDLRSYLSKLAEEKL